MFSRYNAMEESSVVDTEDQTTYPDPLSINFNNAKLTEMPRLRDVSKVELDRFWLYMLKHYAGVAEADDIVLTLNSVPYLGMVEPGTSLYLPIISDLYAIENLKGQL